MNELFLRIAKVVSYGPDRGQHNQFIRASFGIRAEVPHEGQFGTSQSRSRTRDVSAARIWQTRVSMGIAPSKVDSGKATPISPTPPPLFP